MKWIPIALAQHLKEDSTSLAYIWRIKRTDGVMLRFVALDQSIVIGGNTYDAAGSFDPSAIQSSGGMAVDNLEVQGILTSPSITEEDLIGGKYDHAEVQLAMVNWRRPDDGEIKMRRGWLGKVTTTSAGWTGEIRGLLQQLQAQQGRTFQAGCDASLGDTRCQVNLAAYTFPGSIQANGSGRTFDAVGLTQADHYFQGGLLRFTSGANAGFEIEIRDNVSNVVSLQDSAPNPWAAGDTFQAIAGCDKTIETCRTKFANQVNHRGFPLIPGMDRWQAGK